MRFTAVLLMVNPLSKKTLAYTYVNRFSCLGATCEDTCCQGWGMQVDAPRKELYQEKAPELLEAVTAGEDTLVMRRYPETGVCVKYEGGLCGIHKKYGTDFLGDACHFFPRITRKFGDTITVAATLSCPEIARLALEEEDAFTLTPTPQERLPYQLKDYLIDDISSDEALQVINAFLTKMEDLPTNPSQSMAHIVTVSKSLENLSVTKWKDAVPFLLKTAQSRLPEAAYDPMTPYRLFHALAVLVGAAKQYQRPALMGLLTTMEKSLDIVMDWESFQVSTRPSTGATYKNLVNKLTPAATQTLETVLRRWLKTQLAMASYPFAGFGHSLSDRALLLAIRFATVKLALLCHTTPEGAMPEQRSVLHIIQTLSRFLDHLADPTLSLLICKEAGWTHEACLVGVLTAV